MLKKIFCLLLIVTMLCTLLPITGVFASPVFYYEDFEDAYETTTLNDLTDYGYEITDTNARTFNLRVDANDPTNTYLRIAVDKSNAATNGSFAKAVSEEIGEEFALRMRIRLSRMASNADFFRLVFSDGSKTYYQNFLYKKYNDVTRIIAAGTGSGTDTNDYSIDDIQNTGNVTAVTTGVWYDIVFVSKLVNEVKRFEYYVDGVYQGYMDMGTKVPAGASLSQIVLFYGKDSTSASTGRSYDYDDITIYDSASALDVTSSVVSGQTDVSVNEVIKLNFTAPVKLETLDNIKIKNGANEVDATIDYTDSDMRNVTVTPDNVLSKNTPYTLSFNGVTDVMGRSASIGDINFTTSSSDVLIYSEDFENHYTSEVISAVNGYTGNLQERTLTLNDEEGNKYLNILDTVDKRLMQLTKDFSNAGNEFAIRLRTRINRIPANGNIFVVEFSDGYEQHLRFKNGEIIAVTSGGSAEITALKDAGTLNPSAVVANTWYDVVFVSKVVKDADNNDVKRLEYYVDGIYQGYMDMAADSLSADATLKSVTLYQHRDNASKTRSYDYDDIEVYNTAARALASENTSDGSENVKLRDAKLNYTFNAPVDASASVLKKDGVVVDADITAVNGDMKNISIKPASGWEYGASYEFTLSADDLFGGTITDTAVSFTTAAAFSDGGDNGDVAHKLFIAGGSSWNEYIANFASKKLNVVNSTAEIASADFYTGEWKTMKESIGSNDYVLIQCDNADVEYAELVIDEAIEKGAIPILASVIPSIGEEDALVVAETSALEALAAEKEITYLDINALAGTYINGLVETKDMVWSDENNLSPYGAYEISYVFAEAVCDSSSTLKNYIASVVEPATFNADGTALTLGKPGAKVARVYAKGIDSAAILAGVYTSNSLENCALDSTVAFAGDSFVGHTVNFTTTANTSNVMIFIWDSLDNLRPLR